MNGQAQASTRRILVVTGFLLLAVGVAALVFLLRGGGNDSDSKSEPKLVIDPATTPPKDDPRSKLVAAAIDKGVAFLRATLKEKHKWSLTYAHDTAGSVIGEVDIGIQGLIGLTLLECGAGPDDPDVLAVADVLRKAGPTLRKTYVLSTSLFFFNHWSRSKPLNEDDKKLARSLGLRLCAGQIGAGFGKGVWRYDCPVLTEKEEQELLEKLQQGIAPPGAPAGFYSMSNSQFAMLALWGARGHGVPVRETLLRAAEHFHRTQFPDGHWIYDSVNNATVLWTTATAAGLMALAMERAFREDAELSRNAKKDEEAPKRADAAKAFRFVAASIGRKKGDPGGAKDDGGSITPKWMYVGSMFEADAGGDIYYLWTIERLGMIYRMPLIEGKDWYDWGCPLVLDHQKADGSWQDRWQPQVDTCFALLFLRRANLAQDLTDTLQALDGKRRD